MAIIDIRTEPSGRTRMLFDFRAAAPGCDDEARIACAMIQSCGSLASSGGTAHASAAPSDAPKRAGRQAASDRSTSRPVTLPSRRRISAS
jgi:hypothetical protein